MKTRLLALAAVSLVMAFAKDHEAVERIKQAASVFQEIQAVSDKAIPDEQCGSMRTRGTNLMGGYPRDYCWSYDHAHSGHYARCEKLDLWCCGPSCYGLYRCVLC